MKQGFDFFVSGLEDAILALLKEGDGKQSGMTNVKEWALYSGELDKENFVEALKSQVRRFPLVLVSYGSGRSKRKAATNVLFGEPIEMEHQCGFIIICCTNDLRGQNKRRATIYQMIDETYSLLGGVQFERDFENEAHEVEKVELNTEPLLPSDVECITRLPELTAYAVHFDTAFHFWLPDRRAVASNVEEIKVPIVPTNPNAGISGLPGVQAQRGKMKVQNLTDSTMMLGDNRVIGAAGTPDAVRVYHRAELTTVDQDRVESGELKVLEVETKTETDGKQTKEKNK